VTEISFPYRVPDVDGLGFWQKGLDDRVDREVTLATTKGDVRARFLGGDVLPRFQAQLRFKVLSGDPGEPLAEQPDLRGWNNEIRDCPPAA
jgi:hypothetical protein